MITLRVYSKFGRNQTESVGSFKKLLAVDESIVPCLMRRGISASTHQSQALKVNGWRRIGPLDAPPRGYKASSTPQYTAATSGLGYVDFNASGEIAPATRGCARFCRTHFRKSMPTSIVESSPGRDLICATMSGWRLGCSGQGTNKVVQPRIGTSSTE